ncbi:hypothetical protein KAI04_03880 [Candidatus Pacearchaeota archaeon]|nr:hypothetical protein [Candidatus Pacearchaeota archaeon]
MKSFRDRIKLTSSQRNEVTRYLNCFEILTEDTILKLVRKMKEIERRMEEKKYE